MDKLIKKYDRTPIKCDIKTLTPIKISLDDLLVQFLRLEMKYKQSNIITDLKIFVGIISTILAGYLTYLSVYFEFKDYKNSAMVLVITYFAFNLVLELILRLYNRGCIFKGKNENGTIKAYTSLNSPDTNYVVMIYKNGKVIPEKYNKDVCDLFYENGTLLHKAFLNDLNTFLKEESKKEK